MVLIFVLVYLVHVKLDIIYSYSYDIILSLSSLNVLFLGTNKPNCDHCQDRPRQKCTECACHHCGGKDKPEETLMCDECDNAYHIFCLVPKLDKIPDVDEW